MVRKLCQDHGVKPWEAAALTVYQIRDIYLTPAGRDDVHDYDDLVAGANAQFNDLF